MCSLPLFPTSFCLPPFPQPLWLKTTYRAEYLARNISFGGAPADSIPDPTHPCYQSSASILNRQEATSTLPGSSLCDMSMECDLQEAIIFDSAKIKGEFWIRRRELVAIQLPSRRRVIEAGLSLHVGGLPLGRVP